MLKSILALGLACALAAAPAAAAGPGGLTVDRTAAVPYADLELASSAGVAELDRRIGAAIRRVCGTADHLDLKGQADLRSCRAQAQQSLSQQRSFAIAAARQERGFTLAAIGDR